MAASTPPAFAAFPAPPAKRTGPVERLTTLAGKRTVDHALKVQGKGSVTVARGRVVTRGNIEGRGGDVSAIEVACPQHGRRVAIEGLQVISDAHIGSRAGTAASSASVMMIDCGSEPAHVQVDGAQIGNFGEVELWK